jgi:hypothetical protein
MDVGGYVFYCQIFHGGEREVGGVHCFFGC